MGKKELYIGAGVVGLAFLLLGGSRKVSASSREVDALTRLLLAETSFRKTPQEMASIIQVALNRAQGSGRSILGVATPPGRPNWNASSTYRSRWEEASSWPQWARARTFVEEVLAGKFANRIGSRKMFIHPAGMTRKGCTDANLDQPCPDNSSRVCGGTIAGPRCLPKWIHPKYASVVTVASANFA